jgi:hypothetical protein
MSEQDQRQRLINALRTLDAISVENPAYPGTPDINYIGGWIECKWLRSWPKRRHTPVPICDYTNKQKVWARRRVKRGGVVWFILQVQKEWILIEGRKAAMEIGDKTTAYDLRQMSTRIWHGLNDDELLGVLNENKA